MNLNIKEQKAIKAKLGVTITRNMSLSDICKVWPKVPQEIRAQLPEVDMAITSYGTALNLQATLIETKVTVTETYKKVQAAIEDGIAVMAGQPTQPITKALATTARIAEEKQDSIIELARAKAFNLLLEFI